jgi:hypothetical protein
VTPTYLCSIPVATCLWRKLRGMVSLIPVEKKHICLFKLRGGGRYQGSVGSFSRLKGLIDESFYVRSFPWDPFIVAFNSNLF